MYCFNDLKGVDAMINKITYCSSVTHIDFFHGRKWLEIISRNAIPYELMVCVSWTKIKKYYQKEFPNLFADDFFWLEVFDYLLDVIVKWRTSRQAFYFFCDPRYDGFELGSMRDFYKDPSSKKLVGIQLFPDDDCKYGGGLGILFGTFNEFVGPLNALLIDKTIYLHSSDWGDDTIFSKETIYDVLKPSTGPLSEYEDLSLTIFLLIKAIFDKEALGEEILKVYKSDITYLENLIPKLKVYLEEFNIERDNVDFSSYVRYAGEKEKRAYRHIFYKS